MLKSARDRLCSGAGAARTSQVYVSVRRTSADHEKRNSHPTSGILSHPDVFAPDTHRRQKKLLEKVTMSPMRS